jgi:ribonucleoside-triphosphate reductase (thioredoxin)
MQVSCTVTFDPASEGPQLPHALDLFQYQLKGVSFLPRQKQHQQPQQQHPPAATPYPQMPYESISESRYRAAMSTLDVQQLRAALPESTMAAEECPAADEVPDKFCDTAECSIGSL